MAEELTSGQRRADALGLLAEAALAAGLDRGAAGDRYQVVLHVDATASTSDRSARGSAGDAPASDRVVAESRASDGADAVTAGGDTHAVDVAAAAESCPFDGALEVGDAALYVSAETSRRLACDASVVVMHHDPSGTVLDVGRKTRTIPSAIRRALLARDTQCRFPGCSARRCDAHHVVHWANGGRTHLENLVLLCRRHHRAVHEGGFTLTLQPDGSTSFVRPDGRPLEVAPVLPAWVRAPERDGSAAAAIHPLDALTAQLATAGIVVGARSVTVWDGTPFDVAWAMDVLR